MINSLEFAKFIKVSSRQSFVLYGINCSHFYMLTTKKSTMFVMYVSVWSVFHMC